MKIFLPFLLTSIYSLASAQESSISIRDTSATPKYYSDSTTFVFRTDALDLFSTLVEKDNLMLTIGLEFFLNKNYSVRLQARNEHLSTKYFTATEFRTGPEVIKYFSKSKTGSFYAGAFAEYFRAKLIKYDGKLSFTTIDKFISPGIVTGYCYSASKHFIIEPSLRIGYGGTSIDTPVNSRIGLYVGYLF